MVFGNRIPPCRVAVQSASQTAVKRKSAMNRVIYLVGLVVVVLIVLSFLGLR